MKFEVREGVKKQIRQYIFFSHSMKTGLVNSRIPFFLNAISRIDTKAPSVQQTVKTHFISNP